MRMPAGTAPSTESRLRGEPASAQAGDGSVGEEAVALPAKPRVRRVKPQGGAAQRR